MHLYKIYKPNEIIRITQIVDYEKNSDIKEELNIFCLNEKTFKCRFQRTNTTRTGWVTTEYPNRYSCTHCLGKGKVG